MNQYVLKQYLVIFVVYKYVSSYQILNRPLVLIKL